MLQKLVPDIKRIGRSWSRRSRPSPPRAGRRIGSDQPGHPVARQGHAAERSLRKSSATAEELANQSERLQETIAFFRIGDQPAARGGNKPCSESKGKPEVKRADRQRSGLRASEAQGLATLKAPISAERSGQGSAIDMQEDDALDAEFKRLS